MLIRLSFFLLLLLNCSAEPAASQTQLDQRTFRALTSVHVDHEGRQLGVQLDERYSQEQARAIVQVRFQDLNRWQRAENKTTIEVSVGIPYQAATFFASARRPKITLIKNDGSAKCRKVEPNELLRALHLDFLDSTEFSGGKQDHLIGPIRFIKYVNDQRQRMQLKLNGHRALVRNVPSVEYALKLADRSGAELLVSVFYEELSLASDRRPMALPNRIEFRALTLRAVIELHSIRPIKSVDAIDPRAQVELDAFILTPTSGCSQLLDEADRKSLFELRRDATSDGEENNNNSSSSHPTSARRFSFKAQLRHEQKEQLLAESSLAVAYDHRLDMMRVDLAPRDDPLGSVTQVFNFFRNRLYHVLRAPARNANFLVNHLLKLADSSTGAVSTNTQGRPTDEEGRDIGPLADELARDRCTSTPIFATSTWNKYSFGHLLLGSDAFVYLGLGRVRNTRVRIYEAVSSELPYWFDQPVDYRAPSGAYQTRLASNLNSLVERRDPTSRLVTLVYLSDEADERNADRLLLMEIYHMDANYKLVYDKRVLNIYDFTWTLANLDVLSNPRDPKAAAAAVAHRHSQVLDMFSLVDSCAALATQESSQHGRLELLLERIEPADVLRNSPALENLKLLRESPKARNLATLAALQRDLDSLVTLAYDLKTRIIERPQKSDSKLEMLVSVDLARHVNSTNKLLHVGRGQRILGRSWYLTLGSFLQCFMVAAHRGVELYFAFEPRHRHCYVAVKTAEQVAASNEPPFELTSRGSLEVYCTRRLADHLQQIQHNLWAPQTTNVRTTPDKSIRLRDRILNLYLSQGAANDNEIPIRMAIRRLHVEGKLAQESGVRNQIVHKIDGFGLLAAGQNSLKTEQVDTLAECEALCLGDFHCQAYSFCIHGGRAECLLSRQGFSSPALVATIKRQQTSTATFEIELVDGRKFNFKRHSNCAIYNQQYLAHFRRKSASLTGLHKLLVSPVGEPEECARECFGRNLQLGRINQKYLADSLETLRNELEKVQGGGVSRTQAQSEALETIRNSSLRLLMRGCYDFYYLNLAELELASVADEIRQFAGSPPGGATGGGGGYCAIHVIEEAFSNEQQQQQHLHNFNTSLPVDFYEFQFSELYEEEHGVNLRASPMDQAEQAALSTLRGSLAGALEPVDAHAIQLTLGLIERGTNLQVKLAGNRELCATLCFKQTAGLWPACKSFDLIVERQIGHARLKCVFNSITKRQAIEANRWDLIDTSGASFERWHYEPKMELASVQLELMEKLAELGAIPASKVAQSSWLSQSIICLMGLISGLALAFVLVSDRGYLTFRGNSHKRRDSLAPVMAPNSSALEGDNL